MVNLTLMLSLPIYMFFQPITTLLKKEVSGLLAVFIIIAIKRFTHHRINEEYECILIVLVLSYF
ncbi:hypothetical protein BRARA_F00432 [Brassica rapa]|uniref:Uncharacterized protein n=1 Tax=Brassica campestris TaxID=3711 RepID=A0A397YUL5_BRACM|nr:hypothetical protein BRARA_F00432 [Brassica rapa]